ncbi:hypothetical protein CBS101457_003419 [Exobasidium rhododendri]|nr:hypothetical protein CBS101457_003419 [Exobasidium rhododendri]
MSRSTIGSSSTAVPPNATKILSLLNSTLSTSHELVRSISIVSSLSPSLVRPIKRNLSTIAAGIAALQTEQFKLDQEARKSKVSLEEVRRKEDELIEVKGAWDRLCEVLQKDPRTGELLDQVKQSHSTLFDSIQNNQTSLQEQSTPYRDTPLTMESSPSDQPYDGPDNTEIIQSQHQQMYSQDDQLDNLSASIGRQHHLSLQMNEELQTHAELLDEMDLAVDSTGARLGRASRRLDTVAKSLKEHGSTWTIFLLIVVLVMLIAIFK